MYLHKMLKKQIVFSTNCFILHNTFDMTYSARILNNVEVEDLAGSVELKVITKCPTKWLLIDEETGQVYRGSENKEVGKMWELITKQK